MIITIKDVFEQLRQSDRWIKYVNKNHQIVTQTYRETYLYALMVLKKIQSYGLRPHSKIAIVNSDMQFFIISLWAVILGGYTPVLVSPVTEYTEKNVGFRRLVSAVKTLNVKLIVGDINKKEIERFPDFEGVNISLLTEIDFFQKVDLETIENSNEINPQDLALMMLTSGSTGNPKAVPLTHENILLSISGKNKFFSLNNDCVSMSFLPLDHVAGIIEFHLLQCFVGCNQIHVDKEYIVSDPNNFLKLIDEFKVNISMAPNFFIENICENLYKKMTLDLSSLKYLICGGDFNIRDTFTKFIKNMEPSWKFNKKCIVPAFGMTETCAGITYSSDWEKGELIKFLNLGTPIENACMRIKSKNGVLAKEGDIGELEVKGPMVIKGYYDPKYDVGVFTDDGWMKTGDIGFIKESRLYLTGRSKHEIVVNGVNYACQEIEILIRENCDNIIASNIAIVPVTINASNIEQFTVFFTPEIQDDLKIYNSIKKIKEICLRSVGSLPYVVIPVKAEPRTIIGKIDRTLLRTGFEKGDFDEAIDYVFKLERKYKNYVAPGNEIEKDLIKLFSILLNCDKNLLSMNDNLIDLGATSLKVIMLQQGINRKFLVDLPITFVIENPTIKEVANQIALQKTKDKVIRPYNPLVKINLVGDKPPIFMVHPGVGDVLVFIELAKKFYGERPFYAFRARGFNEGEENFKTLDELVSCYLAAIKKEQPKPPYYLAGYSYGASIAYELGRRLHKEGDEVAFIGVMNLPPYIKERMDQLNILEGFLHLCMFISICTKEEIPELKEILKNKPFDECVNYMIGRKQYASRIEELNIDSKKLKNWAFVAQSLVEIGKTFMPSDTDKVRKLHIFHAIPLFDTKEEWLRKLKEWDKYSQEENEYFEAPGEHYTMLSAKNLSKFYDIFSGVLKECDKRFL